MSTPPSPVPPSAGPDPYDALLTTLRSTFDRSAALPLFTTSATGLFAAFLDALPAELRQAHTCSACRLFVDGFGGLVTLAPNGEATSALWDPLTTPEPYRAAVAAIGGLVSRARVDGVFLSAAATWGRPTTGDWHHMAVVPPAAILFKPSLVKSLTAAIAEKREDYGILQRGLAEFSVELVTDAHTMLSNGALYRSEKCEGIARWLMELHKRRDATRGTAARDNVTWLAVAHAPPGFCHVRSSMIGTLLEDLAAGLPFAEVKAKFDAKMHPLQYQRPTAAPSAGNIARAEAIIAELRSAGSLERRFAQLSDIRALWLSVAKREHTKGGVFGHLKTRTAKAPLQMPAVTMTWEKFARTVLPEAAQIEFFVPTTKQNYAAMVTAANADAPPIIQWDNENERNPVTMYVYHEGSPPRAWNLEGGEWCPVTAISLHPAQWGTRVHAHHGTGVILVLRGARDMRHDKGGGFFPETLKAEYHEIRATIEAYVREATIAGRDEAEACGISMSKGQPWDIRVRVTPKSGPAVVYQLDRWD